MIDDLDPAEWLGLPTPEEMWRHQAEMLTEECSLLQLALNDQRKRLATLIQMYGQADQERIRLRKELEESVWKISRANVDASESYKRWVGESMARTADRHFLCAVIDRLGGDSRKALDDNHRAQLSNRIEGNEPA